LDFSSFDFGNQGKAIWYRVISVLSNGLFFIAISFFTFALALAYGLSGP
jgi:hypothetical protein